MRFLPISIALALPLASHAAVIPFGIQTNVSDPMVASWGFSECSRTSAVGTANIATILSGCTGDYLAMGIWDASRATYGVVGIGAFDVVTAITYANYMSDDNGTVQNWSNGLNWYRTAGQGAWGFTTAAETALNATDINLANGMISSADLVGTEETTLAAGLSFYVNIYGELASGRGYNPTGNDWSSIGLGDQRVFWALDMAQGSVPEPGTFALIGLGMVGLIAGRRKERRARESY